MKVTTTGTILLALLLPLASPVWVGAAPTSSLFPFSFEENVGQFHEDVNFVSRGRRYSLFLAHEGPVLVLFGPGSGVATASVLRVGFQDSVAASEISGVQRLPGSSNYFKGNDPSAWVHGVPR
ncbi:MAG: hypothetical protein ACE5E4_10645, partial [Candidatus Binatia bacterium]